MIISTGPTVAFPREDCRELGTVTEHDDEEQNVWCYKINITKTGRILTRTMKHVRQTAIPSEHCIQDKIAKNN